MSEDLQTERDPRSSVQDTPVGTSHAPNTSIKITISNNASAQDSIGQHVSSVAKDK